MTTRKILTEPDLFLRQKSLKVENVDDNIRSLMDDMLKHLSRIRHWLSRIQIGVPKRVIVIDLSREEEEKNPQFFVNPEIINNLIPTYLMKKGVYLYRVNLQK